MTPPSSQTVPRADSSNIDVAKVERLREAIARGTLDVDVDLIAKRLLESGDLGI